MAKLVTEFNPIPILIGGTGRSGTTIVGDLLNEHPEVRTSLPTGPQCPCRDASGPPRFARALRA